MSFQVMDAEDWFIQRQSETAGDRCAYQQGTGQAWTLGVGNCIDCIMLDAAIFKYLLQ